MGRVLACLQQYQKAERYSSLACEGFIRLFIQKHGAEGAYSHDVTENIAGSETRVTSEDEQLFRNLSISFYTNASHKEKLCQFQNALEAALEAKRYHQKLSDSNEKDKSFMNTIELKVDILRGKLNSTNTFKQNNKLIQQRANENVSKLRESVSRPGSANMYSTLPIEKYSGTLGTSKTSKNLQKSEMPQIAKSSKKQRPNSKSQSKRYKILKSQPGKLKDVVKDPATKKNYDSIGIRVTSLYLHNEYFHGNYSNGVQMYMSTSNNEKFFPYKTLNPIPNDQMYRKTERVARVTAGQVLNRPPRAEKPFAKDVKIVEVQEFDSDQEKELVDSFDSNPAEVIELYSPENEEATPAIPQRPKSAAERQREYQLEHGRHPGTVHLQENEQEDDNSQLRPTIDQEDQIKRPPRSKSRSNTHKSQKVEPAAVEDPNFFDNDEF